MTQGVDRGPDLPSCRPGFFYLHFLMFYFKPPILFCKNQYNRRRI